jgi:RNA polymerase sigma-70 factor (ECF subfamily)
MGTAMARGVLGPLDGLLRHGTAAGASDGQLLERFLGRHDEAAEAAFGALVERHGPMVMAVCRRALRDHHDAQDAFQATFLVLARKAGSVRDRTSLADWLYGVARRVSDHARTAAARRREIERRAGQGAAFGYEPCPPEPDIRDEVDRLPRDLREAVILCYLEGLTHEQAAARLGWPVGTVRSRLARARERLRIRLTRLGLAPDVALVPLLARSPVPLALSAELVDSIVRAALKLAARDAAEAGLVSTSAAALTEGVLNAMLFVKIGTAAAVVLAASALVGGAAVWGYQDAAGSAGGAGRPAPSANPSASGPDEPVAANTADSGRLSEPYIAKLVQLLNSARAKQGMGSNEKVHQDVIRIEHVVGEWKLALEKDLGWDVDLGLFKMQDGRLHVRPVQPGTRASSDRPLAAPQGASREDGSQRRLDDLERKVDRILQALEKQGQVGAGNLEPLPRHDPPTLPAKLQGTVSKVDATNKRVEITLGSDDGLVVGHELYIYRTRRPDRSTGAREQVGHIRVLRTDPDTSTAKVLEPTHQRIQLGDQVSPRPSGDLR